MPVTFWLTFRIGEFGDYGARYEALDALIRSIAIDGVWDEPTSFPLFQTKLNTGQLIARIKAVIDVKHDIVALSAKAIPVYSLWEKRTIQSCLSSGRPIGSSEIGKCGA